jgi:hypothetical protein
MQPIIPLSTVTLAVSAVSASVAISRVSRQLEIQNAGDAIAFCRWGIGAQTAVVTDYPVLPGQSKTITIESGNDTFAAITSAGTTTLYITSGAGF